MDEDDLDRVVIVLVRRLLLCCMAGAIPCEVGVAKGAFDVALHAGLIEEENDGLTQKVN